MLGFITAFFTIESSNTKNDKSIKGKIKNDEAIVDTFLNMSLESIEKAFPKPFSSSTHVEKKVNVDENDNGIFSTFYNTAVKYVLDLVAPVVQSVVQDARDYIEGDYNKYTQDCGVQGCYKQNHDSENYLGENYYTELTGTTIILMHNN